MTQPSGIQDRGPAGRTGPERVRTRSRDDAPSTAVRARRRVWVVASVHRWGVYAASRDCERRPFCGAARNALLERQARNGRAVALALLEPAHVSQLGIARAHRALPHEAMCQGCGVESLRVALAARSRSQPESNSGVAAGPPPTALKPLAANRTALATSSSSVLRVLSVASHQ